MSNINQNNFNNCLNLRLSNSDYWDLFICNDCGCGLDHEFILDECLIVDINIDSDECVTEKTLCSLVGWTGDTCFESFSIPKSGVTLNDIGLTGIDNGFITYDCNASTTGSTFTDTYTGSSFTISSADTNFCFTRVSGCTYDYTYNFVSSANTVGRYVELCGGFYQGFFKLSDRTFFKNISDNMFVWPMEWFNCPPSCDTGDTKTVTVDCSCNGNNNSIFIPGSEDDCLNDNNPPCNGELNPKKSYRCYKEEKPIDWDYQILPTRYEKGWTAEFWLRKNTTICSGVTATTLNDLYPDNKGLFYYMGTRSENKFWDVFSGETGHTTTSGYPLSPPKEVNEELLNNPFLVYQPQGQSCYSGITCVNKDERDKNLDIVDNALGFRIKDDGSIGYRSLSVSGECITVTSKTNTDCCEDCDSDCCKCIKTGSTTTEKYITGVTINEEYSEPNIIPDNEWFMLSIRFCAYEGYELEEMKNIPRRKGRLDFFVNGYLKYSIDEFDEFIFKDLIEYREKQEGVPFNYSLGGGTQGLIESNTIGGPDELDNNLIIQNNFAGTFIGDVSRFRLYECCLDITTIRYRFKELCLNYGICPQELICYILSEQYNIISSENGDDFLVWCSE